MHTKLSTQNSRRFFILVGVAVLSLSMLSSGAQAYVLDTKIGEANLASSSDTAEKNALAAILGVNPDTLTMDLKLANDDTGFNVVADSVSGQWFIDVFPDLPGYFLLKFGIGGTSATADTFFFENIGEMTKLVFSNAQVQNLSGGDCGANGRDACNIGRLSHYSTFNGDGGGTPPQQIPEPGVLLLVGAGLLGLGLTRRRNSL